jgi:cardiolipin synthase
MTVLPDGASAFRAMAEAIRGAKHNLNLEYYTIEDVDLDGDGKKLSDLLLEKRREGVAISIIYDSYGSSGTPGAFFDRLRKAGVTLLDFHPISPIKPVQAINLNDRDHRKILVADGEIGIVGGVNLSKSYESKFPGSGSGAGSGNEAPPSPVEGLTNTLGITTKLPQKWRDTAVRIEGPAVAELQKLYVAQWQAEKGPPLDQTGFFPKLEAKGDQVARIIGSTPSQPISRYYVTLVSALRNAESKVWVSAAYFVPTSEEMEGLTDAARRGVDVRLLLPDVSDSKEAIEAAHSHYTDLLEAGVKIYETKDVVLHSKTVVIDGVWSAIGSSNFDHRSVLFNDEVDAIVLGAGTAKALETVFTNGEQTATAIDRDKWEDSRPVTERVRGFFARLWEDLL